MKSELLLAFCASGALAQVGPITAGQSIAAKFAAKDKYFGSIADGVTLNNPITGKVLSAHFNALTAENR